MFEFASALSTVGLSVGITAFERRSGHTLDGDGGDVFGTPGNLCGDDIGGEDAVRWKGCLKKRQNHGGKERAKR